MTRPQYLTHEQTIAAAQRFGAGFGPAKDPGTSTASVLTVDDVAAGLSTTCRNVHRLIARGQLKATRLGSDGPYRVLASAVDAYVAGGAPAFDFPPVHQGGRFDNSVIIGPAGTLAGKLLGIIERSIDPAQVQKAIDQAKKTRGNSAADAAGVPVELAREVPIALGGAVQAAILEPVPAWKGIGQKVEDLSRYQSLGETVLVERLREATTKIIREMRGGFGAFPIDTLYKSAENYRSVVDQAWAAVTSSKVPVASVSKVFTGVAHRIDFIVPIGHLAGLVKRERVELLAL